MQRSSILSAHGGQAIALTLLLSGCHGPLQDAATVSLPATATSAIVHVDLAAMSAALKFRRSIAGLGFTDTTRITQARLVAEGPGVAAGTQATTPWQVAGGTAAAALALAVPGGLNRLFTLQALDAGGHVVASLRGLATVPATGNLSVTLNVNTDAAGRVLADLLAGPGPGDSADTAGVQVKLATTDITADLGTYVTAATGYSVAGNTFTGVNPLRVRDRVLANLLRSNGVSVLQAAPSAAMQQAASAAVTVSVTRTGAPFAGAGGQVTVFDPVSTDAAIVTGGTASLSGLPPGNWAVQARGAGVFAWGTVTVLDQEATGAVSIDLPATSPP